MDTNQEPTQQPQQSQPPAQQPAPQSGSSIPWRNPQRLDLGEALRQSWRAFVENLGTVLGLFFTMALIAVPVFLVTLPVFFDAVDDDSLSKVATSSSEALAFDIEKLPILIATIVVATIVFLVITSIFNAGMYYLAMRSIGHNQKTNYSEAVAMGRKLFVPWIITSLLAGLIIGIGWVLLIVPGLIFLSWYALAIQAMIDQNLSGMDALRESKRIMEGQGWVVVGYIILIAIVVGIIGLIPLIGSLISTLVGILMPFITAHFYYALKNQKEAQPNQAPLDQNPLSN